MMIGQQVCELKIGCRAHAVLLQLASRGFCVSHVDLLKQHNMWLLPSTLALLLCSC